MRISDWSSDVCSSDLLVRALGLYDTLSGLVLSYLILTLPFTTWVLTAFMRELPEELEEAAIVDRSEEHTSELQSLMRISYAVFCLKKKKIMQKITKTQLK